MANLRRHFKQKQSFKDRLAKFAMDMRERPAELAPGIKRDDFLMRARQADTAQHLDEWANSPDLQPPK